MDEPYNMMLNERNYTQLYNMFYGSIPKKDAD